MVHRRSGQENHLMEVVEKEKVTLFSKCDECLQKWPNSNSRLSETIWRIGICQRAFWNKWKMEKKPIKHGGLKK